MIRVRHALAKSTKFFVHVAVLLHEASMRLYLLK